MPTNAELSRIFAEMAALLEITGENVFRVNAFNNAARALGNLSTDVSDLACDRDRLLAIEGIGKGIADRIIEYCQTGRIHEHDELLAKVPPGLLSVMRIPGVGPKTARLLWEKAGVTDVESLKAKIAAGTLTGIPRLGPKVIQNIQQSIEQLDAASLRMRLGDALPMAESIVEQLRDTQGVKRLEYAGSLRRGKETIGDIDLLASTSKPELLVKRFKTMPMIEKVIASGQTKTSIRLNSGMQVDLRIIDEKSFGAALLYFTGSKQHNIVMRDMAIKKGWRLNEYGLFPDDGDPAPPQERGVKPLASKTEQDVYKKLGLPWIPPEMREDQGEFDLLHGKVPALIEIDDIQAELHAHTIASDGRLTIEQLALEAKSRGFHTIAVTDHSKASFQANGLSVDRLLKHIDEVRNVDAKMKGISILAGAEVDILIDGRLDYDDRILEKLDIVIASPHASLKQPPEVATKRLLKAIKHPLVHIIGHPTGRLINRREGLHPEMNKLIEAAVEYNTALEINANSWRLDLRDVHVRAAVDAGVLIAINTDAHTADDFDQLRYGVLTARRGWLTAKQCLNAWSKAKLHEWLRSKR